MGSGWLGKPLAVHFAQLGYEVKLSTRSAEKQAQLRQEGFSSFIVDIDKPDTLDPAFLNADILIINITSKNLPGFKTLISAIENSPTKQVLFISSSSVYKNLNRLVNEDENAENPDSPLYQIENLFRQSQQFTTTVVRFSGLVGQGRHPGRFFRAKPIPQADAPINLIHFDDCIGLINSIVEQSAWGEVFNGCSDSHPSKRDFYTQAAKLLSLPAPDCTPSQTSAFKIVGNDKIKQQLGYQLRHPDLLSVHDYGIDAG